MADLTKTSYSPTPFIEANALLSVQSLDGDSARAALIQMTPKELADLSMVCSALQSVIAKEYERQTGRHIVHAPSWSRGNPYDAVCET